MLGSFFRKRILLVILIFFTISLLVSTNGCKKNQPESATTASTYEDLEITEKIDLRILYAGLLNTERAKDFTDFLSRYFKEVKTTDFTTFTGNESIDFDVAVLDNDGLETQTKLPNISRQYTRATVMMGVPSADICSRLSLKTGYL